MPEQNSTSSSAREHLLALCAVVMLGLLLCTAPRTFAQATNDNNPERKRGLELFEANNFIAALPLLEKAAAANPSDVVVLEALGFSIYANSSTIKDPAARRKERERARTTLLRAQQLGDNSNLLQTALQALAAGDATDIPFSAIKDADKKMREAEAAFMRGELDNALAAYESALRLDPKLYEAAVFAGDVYFKKGYAATDAAKKSEYMNKAGEWFARAIQITENRETAHRYWGDALMHQGKRREALLKFIDAIIAEPGNRNGYMGLSQWGEQTQTGMAHPKIDIPVKLSLSGDKKLEVNFDPALRESSDGSGAWEQYGLVRAKWVAEEFAKAFPAEQAYRHSLREETEALRKTAEAASELLKSGKIKSLSPSLAALVKLNDAGLLEPYIFFARVDQGIARDYEAYRQANRDKLRRYWAEFVISNGR
jgi:tetratricopeptide (TPR) repeat protein